MKMMFDDEEENNRDDFTCISTLCRDYILYSFFFTTKIRQMRSLPLRFRQTRDRGRRRWISRIGLFYQLRRKRRIRFREVFECTQSLRSLESSRAYRRRFVDRIRVDRRRNFSRRRCSLSLGLTGRWTFGGYW